MEHCSEVFVGIDVAKAQNAVAVADGGRAGDVRFIGEVDASEASVRRVVKRIAATCERAHFCYEAGPTGYGLHRLITSLGHPCAVVAPSLIPRKPGDRVKTNRRDAVALARLFRAGELTAVWVPDEGHEAMGDLVRARAAGTVYVFRAKRADRIKLIYWDGTGLCLFAKRLEDGDFRWPKIQDGVMRLTSAQLGALLEGLDWRRVHQARRTRTPVAAG